MTTHSFTFRRVDHDAFPAEAATLLREWILEILSTQERCIVALSGGSTPVPVYERLSKEAIEWERVDLVLVDERYTAADSKDSNQRMIRACFPGRAVLAPDTALPLHAATDGYERALLQRIGNGRIDIAVLGMGDDGHIASLFPPVTEEGLSRMGIAHTVTNRFAVHDRIGMTLPLLGKSGKRLLLLSSSKEATWNECMDARIDPKRWPIHALLDDALTVLVSA